MKEYVDLVLSKKEKKPVDLEKICRSVENAKRKVSSNYILTEEDKSKIISLSPDLCRECMFELAQMLDSDVYDNGDIVSRLREMIK